MFLFALDSEIIEKTPMIEISRSMRMKKPKNEDEPFSHEELARLLEVAPIKYRLFFMTLMGTGCRFGEACGLHWSDFDGSGLTIQRTANQGRVKTPKNGKTRKIDLSPQLLSELQLHRRKELESSFRIGKKPKIIFNEDGTYFEYHRIRTAWITSSRKKFGTNLDHPHLST